MASGGLKYHRASDTYTSASGGIATGAFVRALSNVSGTAIGLLNAGTAALGSALQTQLPFLGKLVVTVTAVAMNAANGDGSSGSGLAGVNEADTYGMSPNGAASPPPTDPNQGNLKIVDQGKLAKVGIDAPALKKEMAGTGGGRYNISVDTATGDVYLSPVRKGSGNPLVDTGYKYNQFATAFPLK